MDKAPQSATGTTANNMARHSMSSLSTHSSIGDESTTVATPARAIEDLQGGDSKYMPLKTGPTQDSQRRPGTKSRNSSIATEEDLFRVLSRRRTSATGKSDVEVEEEHAEIERLMSRMFGRGRQEHSEEEKTRHVGVVFRGLTVKGLGLGAALQPSVGDIFLGLPRFLRKLITKGPKVATAKSPVRELLSDFNGCIKPGEMLLVLGKPGSGCSTFLKVLGNQRFGYEGVQGDVTYGGTDAKKMAKDFRGEVLYNPEDDLHYATLTVKQTLKFALKTRTPGKESRNEGESRKDYVREFLRVVTKLFWIEHTLGTKVGNRKLLCPFQSYVVVARKLFQSQARWTPGSAKARKPIYRIRHLSHNDISPATSGQNHHGYLGLC
jgi:ATP-binding cassette subfamily G (WHITE) protein 2 (SNQ2)